MLILLGLACISCSDLFSPAEDRGFITISFSENVRTRSNPELPDIGDFLLSVTDSRGETVYKGSYSDSPEKLEVPAGAYTVSAVSLEFDEASYSSPQYGDTQVVTVAAGSSVSVTLNCVQQNAGIRVRVSAAFQKLFPESTLLLQGEGGRLEYAYAEQRTAYFKPGKLSVSVSDGGKEQSLFTRDLAAREILTLNLTASESGAGVDIQLDTARTWSSYDFNYGDNSEREYDVTQAREHSGENGVWVYGYICGAFSSSSRCEFEAPFSKNTNIVLGPRSNSSDKAYCLSVELKSGEIRNALNLVDHPENKGKKIWIRGDLVSGYYGIPGMKNVTGFELD